MCIRERVKRVFSYLYDVKKLSESIIRNINKYDLFLSEADLPVTDGCVVNKSDSDGVWLKVVKQNISVPPEPPSELKPYIEGEYNNPTKEPRFNVSDEGKDEQDMYENEDDSDSTLMRKDVGYDGYSNAIRKDVQSQDEEDSVPLDEVKETWEEWITAWRQWAEEARPKYEVQKLYKKLFDIYLMLERGGEYFEIVWGHGTLAWDIQGEKVLRPVFTTRMQLLFDADKGEFLLIPSEDGTRMELDMLDNLDLPNMDKIMRLKRDFEDSTNEINPWSIDDISPLLYQITHFLSSEMSPDGEVRVGLSSVSDIVPTRYPVFYNAPVIILRKVNAKVWLTEIQNILDAIDRDYPIPPTLKSLVTTDKIPMGDDEIRDWKSVGEDLLFPLPANEDQKEIVRRLSKNYGVVVQGPPGTGKSHTIANLICHLLAHGKRILVTSQTDKALKVLSDKIPKVIRSLCISLLGNDARAFEELDHSIRGISEHLSTNIQSLYGEIQNLKSELERCRSKQSELYNQLKSAEVLENTGVKYHGREYTLSEMAQWLRDNEKDCSWIPDKVDINQEIPLSEDEFQRLLWLVDGMDKGDWDSLNKIGGVLELLPPYEEISEKVNRRIRMNSQYDYYDGILRGWTIPEEPEFKPQELSKLLDEAEAILGEMENSWLYDVMAGYYASELARPALDQLLSKCVYYINELTDIRNELYLHEIKLPEISDMSKFEEDFQVIFDRVKSGGSINGLFRLLHRKCNYILDGCKIDGKGMESAEQAGIIAKCIKEYKTWMKLKNLWNNTVRDYNGEMLQSEDMASIIKIENYIKKLNSITHWDDIYKSVIIDLFGNIDIPLELDWHKKKTYTYLKEVLNGISFMIEYRDVQGYINGIEDMLKDGYGLLQDLRDALHDDDTERLRQCYDEVQRLKDLIPDVNEMKDLLGRLNAVCPSLTYSFINTMGEAVLSGQFKNWKEAWKWRQWDTLIQNVHKIRPEDIEHFLETEKNNEKNLIKKLVAKMTWYNQIMRTDERQKRSLYAWMQAVRRIGKGTGKYAAKHRKDAQREMEVCKDAIPVWIMPLNRVIENIRLSDNLFDVVIFDESSQSDIFSLCALMRAKRAVIVGDDKQISPEGVGINQTEINELIDRHLYDIPNKARFDLQTSLYDTALRIFPNSLMLKEHFRCVPEIIQFSNDLCYSGEIIPLRHPLKEEIFEPAIKTVRVSDGFIDDDRINKPEAERVVNAIINCCKSDMYTGMTMGVISLLGEAQAALIENMLRDSIGEQEMIARKLICGDAYSFQGDERDIMFLSMVIAPNKRFSALTRESDIRRFNVAASRAKNQMWLFHSVDLQDLNKDCVRFRLLNYCLDPKRVSREASELENVFESKLEKDVFKLIKARGYAVKPQVKVGKYRIDLVIEGMKNRLAIECDGDRWHGLDRWENDHQRQMELERVGWTFVRIRASEFYRNPERAMQKLWNKLDDMGIEKWIEQDKIHKTQFTA